MNDLMVMLAGPSRAMTMCAIDERAAAQTRVPTAKANIARKSDLVEQMKPSARPYDLCSPKMADFEHCEIYALRAF